jgi:hypothetical protein
MFIASINYEQAPWNDTHDKDGNARLIRHLKGMIMETVNKLDTQYSLGAQTWIARD